MHYWSAVPGYDEGVALSTSLRNSGKRAFTSYDCTSRVEAPIYDWSNIPFCGARVKETDYPTH